MNKLFKYIILFSLLLVINVKGQVCNYCNKKITSNYIEVEGKKYHPNHFLCSACGRQIEGKFTKHKSKFYHQSCYKNYYGLKCDYCKKPIDGGFVDSEDGIYHESCFNNFVVDKCEVCGKALIGEYLVDVHGLKYHKIHKEVLPTCSNCNRIISERTTNGGVKLEDERSLCNNCFNKRIKSNNSYTELLKKVVYNLSSIGLKIRKDNISIQPVNKIKLAQVSNNTVNNYTKGFCQTSYKYKEKSGKKEKFDERHTIYVLDRLPEKSTESIIAHELMHVWMHQNDIRNLPSKTTEGACNFISYLYFKGRIDYESEEIILLLENDTDPIYGDGFREIKNRFENKSVNDLLKFLKNY
jgi:hypothetical protein